MAERIMNRSIPDFLGTGQSAVLSLAFGPVATTSAEEVTLPLRMWTEAYCGHG
jgi:hypothetical protein